MYCILYLFYVFVIDNVFSVKFIMYLSKRSLFNVLKKNNIGILLIIYIGLYMHRYRYTVYIYSYAVSATHFHRVHQIKSIVYAFFYLFVCFLGCLVDYPWTQGYFWLLWQPQQCCCNHLKRDDCKSQKSCVPQSGHGPGLHSKKLHLDTNILIVKITKPFSCYI